MKRRRLLAQVSDESMAMVVVGGLKQEWEMLVLDQTPGCGERTKLRDRCDGKSSDSEVLDNECGGKSGGRREARLRHEKGSLSSRLVKSGGGWGREICPSAQPARLRTGTGGPLICTAGSWLFRSSPLLPSGLVLAQSTRASER